MKRYKIIFDELGRGVVIETFNTVEVMNDGTGLIEEQIVGSIHSKAYDKNTELYMLAEDGIPQDRIDLITSFLALN